MFRIWIILLLLFAGVAYAAPPATPTLDIRVEGLKAEAKWSAVGATGYRLFYAPHSDVTNLKTLDMGTETQISAVLEPGTALYVAVQAYNDDGDSTPTEFKFFMIQDPNAEVNSTDDVAEESHPTAVESLTFSKVTLDTPVAFVPSAEDSKIQEQTIQSQDDNAMYGAAFEEGKISMTIEIAPTGVKRDSLELMFCLGDENGCDPLIVWNTQEPKGFVKTVTILDLPDDIEKSVYVDLLMPASLAEKLRSQPVDESHEYTIYAYDVNSTGSNAKLVPITKIPVVNLGEPESDQTEPATTAPETAEVTEETGGQVRAALREVVYNPANQHYYRIVDYSVSYYEAFRAAKISSYNNLRGSLMVINDPAERTFIQSNNKLELSEWGIYWIWDGNTTETGKGMTLGGPGYKYPETSKDASTKLSNYIIEYAPSSAKLRDPVYNSANKHYYQVVDYQTGYYNAFQAAATSSHQGLPGSLLVINDDAERTFVQNNLNLEQWGIYWISNSSAASTSLGGSGYSYKEEARDGSSVLGSYIVEYGVAPPASTGSTSGGTTGGTSGGTTGTGTSGGSTGSTGSTSGSTTAEKPPKLISCKITGRELTHEEKQQVVKAGGDTTSTFTGVRCYKEFGKNFSSKAAGVRFAMKPNVWIYKLVPPPNLDKNKSTTSQKKKTEFGVRIGVIGEVKATIVGVAVNVAAIDLGLLKNRGKNPTRSGDVYVLDNKVATYGEGKVKTSKTDEGAWQNCQLSSSNCSTAPVNESDNGLLDDDAEDFGEVPDSAKAREAKNLIGFTKGVGVEYKQTFVIGFIPVEAKAGIYGVVNIGLGFSIGEVDITTDTDTMGIDVTLLGGPGANLTVRASAGVTILIATVGVEVSLTLIEDELVFSVTAKLRKNFRIGGKIENILQGPYGSLLLYVTWYQPAFSIPPWEKKRKEKTLVSWDSGLKNIYTLFSWGDNGDEVKGAESKDIPGGGTPSRYDYVPVVVDKEPAEGTDINGQPYSPRNWVCFYQHENFQGTPACVEMPEEYQEVGFDVMNFDNKQGAWNDSISSIKIWGPLRVAIFEHTLSEGDEKRGSSAYWYAHEGQMEEVQYVGNSLNDQATGVMMTRITEQSKNPFKRRVETVQVPKYRYEYHDFNSRWDLNRYLETNPGVISSKENKLKNGRLTVKLGKPDGVKDEERWNYFPEICFYRDKDDKGGKGNYYCYPSGSNQGGGFDSVTPYNGSGLGGDVFGKLGKNTNDWRNEVSYLSLKGTGPYMLCLFDNDQGGSDYIWKKNGDNSCFMRARMRRSSEGIALSGMNDKMNEFHLMQDVGFALIEDFSSTLEAAGTSSLPNSDKMIARGPLAGIYRRTGRGNANVIHRGDSASIIFVTGPITVRLYKDANQKGTHSTFYLDEGEWDVSYLNGINDAVSSWTVKDSKDDGWYRDK